MNRKSNPIHSYRSQKTRASSRKMERKRVGWLVDQLIPTVIFSSSSQRERMFLYLILFFNLLTGCHSQMLIRLVILDDQDDPQRMIYFDSTNVTLCHQSKVRFEISWMNSSQALKNTYRFEQNQPVIFLARTARFSTRFIRDFCQIRRIPFFTARSIDQENSFVQREIFFSSKQNLIALSFRCSLLV